MTQLTPYLFLLGLVAPPIVHGSSFSIQEDFPDAVQEAPLIVRGTIGMSSADWGTDDEGRQKIYTSLELQVTEIFKGNLDTASIIMREIGGQTDGIGMQIAGASEYSPGEDVLMFLNQKNKVGSFDVVGMMTGKYNIEKDSNGIEYLVGLGLVSSEKWSLDAFRRMIQVQSFTVPSPLPEPSEVPSPTEIKESQTPPLPSPPPDTSMKGIILSFLVLISILSWAILRKK